MLEFLKSLFRRRAAGPATGDESLRAAVPGQRRSEAGLRQSGEHFGQLVAGVRDYAVVLLDREGNVATWNAGAERIKGYTAEEIVGQHFSRFYPDDAVASGLPAHELSVASATGRFEDEGWRVRKGGSRFWANVLITALPGDSGEVRGFLKITRDLTERKQAEENARRLLQEAAARRTAEEYAQEIDRRREQLRVTLRSIGDGVIATDAEGRVTLLNPVAEALTGWKNEEAAGQPLRAVFPIINEVTGQAAENPIAKVLATGGIGGLPNYTVLVAKDGTGRPVDDSAAPIRDEQGRIIGAVLVFRDITERRRAEEELRKTTEQLQIVTESMAAPVTRCGRDLRYLWVSKPYADWIGRPPEEIVGRPILDILGEEAFRQLRPRFEQVLAGEKVQYEEEVNYRGRGLRGTNAVYTPTFDQAGVPDGWVAVVIDITERRRMEEALRDSEQRFARFMQHLPGLAWIKDLQGRYVYANDAAMKVFRRTPDGLYGKTDDEVFPPETAAQFKRNDGKVLAGGAGVQVIETLGHEDGIIHHSIASKFPILGPDGNPALVGGMAIDITDHLRAEEVLAESERRFRQLAENIKEVFWMADPQITEILYISPAYEQVWGRSCQSLYERPRSFLDAVHPDDRERVRVAALEKQGRGELTDEEYRVVRPDGSVRWVRDRAFPVRDAGGRVYRTVGIAEDITEKRRAEEALKEADRRKTEFLATLAHELRNPLAPIRTGVELLRGASGDAAVMERVRSMMERQVGQMVRLIDDLLDISRITRGRLPLRKERVELAAVAGSAVETSRPLIEASGHELTVTLPPDPTHLDADPTRLAQVFSNLLNNAAKYTDKGGHIWLTAERQGHEVIVSVRDTGAGIPAEHLPDIFETFSQPAPALERSQGGLGIGLSLVRGLVELHGGTVEARSGGLGKGSEFIVRLPVVDVPVQQVRPELSGVGEESRCGAKCRILVVDDNRDAADSLGMMLRLRGHDIQTAHDGVEAVQAAATFRPAIVLLDIGMPKMNGYEAARHIREQPWGKGMLLVALTGWGQEEDKRRSIEAGFDHHLTKPVDPDCLVLEQAYPGGPGG